ncbi:ABC transporter ATP-binding protein [Stappia stellulata]|uniref:ABC transporter ATP-binding protein n=1 Tax=Stappia stellulata TaxID=71235 RepID=UPI0003FD0A27|nr:ABC transporter ATP-binding protein [Stappia stellulata]
MLRIEDLCLEAGSGVLVDGIDLAVDAGEMLGLVGESGCGKTITALSVLGLLPRQAVRVTQGRILFNGRDIASLDDDEMNTVRGNDISMIFQEPMTSLNPVMTLADQIGEGLALHRDLHGARQASEVDRLLALVGLPNGPEQRRRYPHQLSGGQRQRVMIAMALACEPALLIADEPTTALDVTIQAQILDLIGEMRARFGMACILVTHDLGVVAETCDTVAVMYAGRIVEQGPVADVFRTPRHRYTEALLRTIPAANAPGAMLPAISGTVPQPGARPPGCAFAERCHEALPQCAGQRPPRDGTKEHFAMCWNPAS